MATHSNTPHTHDSSCSCCSHGLRAFYEHAARALLSRRHVLAGVGSAAVGAISGGAGTARIATAEAATRPAITPSRELVVQPVLTYAIPKRAEQTSWRPWGGLQTLDDVTREITNITRELQDLGAKMGPSVRFRPVAAVDSDEKARQAAKAAADVMLIYAATGSPGMLEKLIVDDKASLFFLRHRSGPVSLWYEVLHPWLMRKAGDEYKQKGVDRDDVIVDDYAELEWRLRALRGLRLTTGQRILAIGGPSGWGEGKKLAPDVCREKWHLDIHDVSYEDLGNRIRQARQNQDMIRDARERANRYLSDTGVQLHTNREYIENAFVLTRVFKDLLEEHQATALTVNHCMGTIMPISETTACLPLSLLNDEGLLAFCESDFVVIPSGMLMHHIMRTPVFLNDPTWPHHGMVTLAHCTAPRRMNGKQDEPVQIHTHFESDYGAAPKVEMTLGQVVTNVIPDFASRKWVGCVGRIIANPFHDICRSQIDVQIDGDWRQLVEDMRGFHWMTIYGDCRREVGYAIKRLGIEWQDVSARASTV